MDLSDPLAVAILSASVTQALGTSAFVVHSWLDKRARRRDELIGGYLKLANAALELRVLIESLAAMHSDSRLQASARGSAVDCESSMNASRTAATQERAIDALLKVFTAHHEVECFESSQRDADLIGPAMLRLHAAFGRGLPVNNPALAQDQNSAIAAAIEAIQSRVWRLRRHTGRHH